MTNDDPIVGRVLDGRYRVRARIAAGGMATVYRAEDMRLDRTVAVKVMHPAMAADASFTDRFIREAKAAARLAHPNVVGVFDQGHDGDVVFLAMEYVEGRTLRELLQDLGTLTPREAFGVLEPTLAALGAAHRAGFVHRDVKPENVLVSPYGEPQLSDFGIARMADSSTTVGGAVWATIAYAAPEVLDGRPASEASDVYGLGATLHACLAGRAPFVAGPDETLVALVARVMTAEPPSLVDHGVPAPLAAVVARAMAKDPAARQVSAVALRRDLEGVAQVLERASSPPPPATVPAGPVPPPPASAGPAPLPVGTPVAVADAAPPAPAPDVPPAPGPDAGPPPSHPSSRRGAFAALAAVVVVLALAAGAYTARDDGRSDPTAATTPDPTTESVASTETTAPPTTAPTTTAPSTTAPTTSLPPGLTSSPLATAALTYLGTVAAEDFDRAWSLTSSRFRQVQDREGWRQFWSGIDDVEVVGEPRVSPGEAAVVVPIRVDGQREDYRLTFVQEQGAWLVDGPTSR